jgi:uncharacterized protein Yka (UPF0111/DUF47 family)
MSILQQLLGSSGKFYDLLDASSKVAFSSVRALRALFSSGLTQGALEVFAEARRADKKITADINQEIARSVVTALEREDIVSLSAALYKIPKTVEKFVERLTICSPWIDAQRFSKQGQMMEDAAQILVRMVTSLRNLQTVESVQQDHADLQRIEGEADKLMLELLRDLYTGPYEPRALLALKDLYELLEKVIDSCRDAGNVVFQISLKNS